MNVTRRDLLKATTAGVLGATALSAAGSVSGHESYETSARDLIEPTLVQARPERGFNYPYFLYAPEPLGDGERPILVEPNNTGAVTDDYLEHLARAEGLASNGNGRTLSEALTVPLVVPVFPRSRTDPTDGNTYTHALDVDTLEVTSGEAARIDEQLLAMVDHAAELLASISYPVQGEEILMHGFSASGNFVNRFPAVHPERVRAVTAGGVNGTAILPIAEDKGHTLNYHIGIADLEELVGEPFDLDAFREVRQYIYMGAEDDNDTIPYSDAWDDTQREVALDVYGEDMQAERMPYCESVYDEAGVAATFEIYDGVGHKTTAEMMADLVDFHRQSLSLSRIGFATPPNRGNTSVALTVTVDSETADSYDVRVFDESGADVTASPETIPAKEAVDAHVDLSRELEAEETVTAAVLPTGTSDRQQAIADTQATVIDTARVAFAERPAAGGTRLELEYAIDGEYETETPIHVFVVPSANSQFLLDTLESGSAGTSSYRLDTSEEGVPFTAGDTLAVSLTDVETDQELARAETTVADRDEVETPASVAFAEHPIYDDTEMTIEYSLDSAYEVEGFAGLYFQTGENPPVLLDRIASGEGTTASYPVDKYPYEAADEAVVSIVDGAELARDEAVVFVREPEDETGTDPLGDAVAEFSYSPEEPTAGESVAFDATASQSPNGEILSYEWQFGEDATRAGEKVSYTFEESETYTVRLELVDDAGESGVTERQISVSPLEETPSRADTGDEATATATEDAAETTTDSTDGEDGPGFGVVSGLAGLAGAGYLLQSGRDSAAETTDTDSDD